MKKRTARDRGGNLGGSGNLRKDARQSVVDNAIQLPFQGIAHMGQGRERINFKAGLVSATKVGVKIRF